MRNIVNTVVLALASVALLGQSTPFKIDPLPRETVDKVITVLCGDFYTSNTRYSGITPDSSLEVSYRITPSREELKTTMHKGDSTIVVTENSEKEIIDGIPEEVWVTYRNITTMNPFSDLKPEDQEEIVKTYQERLKYFGELSGR